MSCTRYNADRGCLSKSWKSPNRKNTRNMNIWQKNGISSHIDPLAWDMDCAGFEVRVNYTPPKKDCNDFRSTKIGAAVHLPGKSQQRQPNTVEKNKAQNGTAQYFMSRRKSKKDVRLADKPGQLHEQANGQNQAVTDGISQCKKIRDIPHQEQNANPANGGFAGNARQFISPDKSSRREDKEESGLQVPGSHNSDQQAGKQFSDFHYHDIV